MHGEAALFLPALNGALVAAEEACDLFPGVESAVQRFKLGDTPHFSAFSGEKACVVLTCPEMSRHAILQGSRAK